LLERTLKSQNASLEDIDELRLKAVMAERNIDSFDSLLEAIGLGNQMAYVIAKKVISVDQIEEPDKQRPLAIMGTEGLVVTYAKCCKPIPGDPIMGHISAGRGIVIHMDTCKNMHELREKPEELMSVRWDPNVNQDFAVELRVELEHERGIVAVLASTITTANANIERINMVEKDARLGTVNIVLSVKDRVHLANVIKRLRTLKGVNKIIRTKN